MFFEVVFPMFKDMALRFYFLYSLNVLNQNWVMPNIFYFISFHHVHRARIEVQIFCKSLRRKKPPDS